MCFELFHLHAAALRNDISCYLLTREYVSQSYILDLTMFCLFSLFVFFLVSQINLGISDFRMLMMVVNDNLLEGRGGEF